ncbi:ABC transporter ATP-binding protein [Candidatus Woesearchaeota archaeon]|nr:ABC transporter ATP-binding protein [Candidatus Woesearchaeota archaeon]
MSLTNYLSFWKLKYDEIRAEKDSQTTAVLADAITNHSTIQLFTGHAEETQRYNRVTEEHAKRSRTAEYIGSTIELVQTALFLLIEFVLIYLSIYYWGFGLITIGTIVLLQSYLDSILIKLWEFGRVIRDIYESIGDAKEMVNILNLPHEIQDMPGSNPIKVTKGEIEFKNVQFHFQNQKSVLKGVSMKVKPGEKIALIGPSGAGKSTFVRLLFRFYNLKEGKILIDNQDIAKVTQSSLRKSLSLVPQDPVLFHRTLLENIRYGRKNASDNEVHQAARLAHCDEFINHLSKRYNTYVGERGIKLSGGERQRVAIARAMLKNAPILVLDEATSSLDSHSEALIQDALEKLMKNKTTIVIAHRLSTIRKMDRIIVIDKGKIIEQGTHAELVKKNSSLYKKLWTLQAGGFIVSPKIANKKA